MEFISTSPKDTKLPSEEQLCIKFQASRVTIRRALSELIEKGYIYSYQGKGYFIKHDPQESPTVQSKGMVMYIYPDQTTSFPLKILKGLSDFFDKKDILLLNFPTFNILEKEDYYIMLAEKFGCTGLIIMPIDKDIYTNVQLSLILKGFPTVLVDRKLFGLDLACISSDHYKMTFDATTYLLARRKNVLFIEHHRSASSSSDRINGYTDAVAQKSDSTSIIYDPLNFSDFYKDESENTKIDNYAAFLSENDVNGVICNSGLYTDFTIKAFKRLGKKLNDDYDLVVLDSDSDNLNEMVGKISYIHQNAYQIGQTAAQELYNKIKSNKKPQSHIIPHVSNLISD